jgi:hypothetical protein
MAAKQRRLDAKIVAFDVFYDDGTRSSNRKVPGELVGGLDGDEPARNFIEEQERRIAEASGKPQRRIERMVRSGGK